MKNPTNLIYLASKSPRRHELLQQIGVQHELLLLRSKPPRGPDISEEAIPGESPENYVTRVTQEKASFAWKVLLMRKLHLRPILTADTTVVLDGKILGKPANFQEALQMLQSLSGRTHQVLTTVAIQHHEQLWQTSQISEVTFTSIADEMIHTYCTTGDPYDKAGGYGIQGMAAVFIEHITGSYSGIMGLPLFETTQLLRKAGIRTL